MPIWKRLGSLLLSALLLVAAASAIPRFGAAQQWLILFGIPTGLVAMWVLARHQGLTSGAWGDYVWGCLVGILVFLMIHALVSSAPLPEAIGGGLSMGAFVGLGLGLLVSGLRGSFAPPKPSQHHRSTDSAA